MKRHIVNPLVVLFMLIWSIAVSAQNRYNMTGAVFDRHGDPISYASAVLYENDKILTGGVTDDKGRFSLAVNSSAKELELSIEFIGYIKKVMPISPDGHNLNIGNIILNL